MVFPSTFTVGDTPFPMAKYLGAALAPPPPPPPRPNLPLCTLHTTPSETSAVQSPVGFFVSKHMRYAMLLPAGSVSDKTGPRVSIVAFRKRPSTAVSFTLLISRWGAAVALGSAVSVVISFSAPLDTIG